ncbi:MAG: AmmeMemoRadiSam system radical SAM enzyme [Candidatus Cloacimonetes bacterium]|nr:AmmeMemoRadiSam system radical SAM enzyme [Candidatus Cloacimonadota bacterium]MCB5279141.1 AmmeMemoRadiSam system radical SAM enzyme [Candidatus Cloacimonadota bacterium]
MSTIMREAMFYKNLNKETVQCELCPHYCVIHSGEQGKCRSRENIEGKLYANNYAQSIGISIDPIEKKPLYHFRPGSRILSLGPNSCNLNCKFCQNYSISQLLSPTISISIDDLYQTVCSKCKIKQIAFTYTEPLTWYEYIIDFAEKYPDVDVVLISNAYINPEPLKRIIPYIKAINIDLKSFTNEFYQDLCSGSIDPVKKSIEMCVAANIHTEITLLLIPSLNNNSKELELYCQYLAEINKEMPLHISAYHPDYLIDTPPTSIDDVASAIAIAKNKLDYVYGGNLPIDDYASTKCPNCGKEIIERRMHWCRSTVEADALCPHCKHKIYGVYDF